MGGGRGGEGAMMPRVFWPERVQVGSRIVVGGADGHHFARVLRAKAGEQATVAAAGTGYLAVIRSVDSTAGSVELELVDELAQRDARHKVYLIQATAKADKVDEVVQKCTEVGVAGVLVYESARSVVRLNASKRTARVARWNKVAKEAAIQCQRDTIPVVHHASGFAEVQTWLRGVKAPSLLLLDEAERSQGLKSLLQQSPATGVGAEAFATVLVVGPEGGWEDEERTVWGNLGAMSVSLGPRILRTETAGVTAAAAVLYEFGDLGG